MDINNKIQDMMPGYYNIRHTCVNQENLFCYKGIFEILPDGILILFENKIITCNEAAVRMFGYSSKSELIGLYPFELSPITQLDGEYSSNKEKEYINRSFLDGSYQFEWIHKKKDGTIFYAEVLLVGILFENRSYICAHIRDITELENMFKALKDKEKQAFRETLKMQKLYFQQLFENSPEAIAILDNDSKIININKSFENLFGYGIDEIRNKSITNVICSEDQFSESINYDKTAQKGEVLKAESIRFNKEGRPISVSILSYPIVHQGKQIGIYVIYSDITERKQYEEKLNLLAYRDSLTGLYNRTYFIEKLNKKIAECSNGSQPMALMYLDIDSFKKFNDNLGSIVGDKVLIYLSQKLKETITSDLDIIARLGADEFIILLADGNSVQRINDIAEKVIKEVNGVATISGHGLFISVSAGISSYPGDGEDAYGLIKNAKIALDEAKKKTNNKIQIYSPDLGRQVHEDFIIDNDVRYAIEKNQLLCKYQPIVNAQSGKILGAEILMRWNHPQLGSISPDKFIRLAEKNRSIVALGEWILRNACMQIKRWNLKGYGPLFVAINVSVVQLEQGNFAEIVKKIITEENIDSSFIEFEITETAYMENLDKIICELKKIKALGIKVAIDDFGTGYSSLGQLKKLKIDKLKIDKAFIRDIGDENNDNIIKVIISLAKGLNLCIVAEGVEELHQLELLQTYECDMLQGYLFEKPMEPETFEEKLKESIFCKLQNKDSK